MILYFIRVRMFCWYLVWCIDQCYIQKKAPKPETLIVKNSDALFASDVCYGIVIAFIPWYIDNQFYSNLRDWRSTILLLVGSVNAVKYSFFLMYIFIVLMSIYSFMDGGTLAQVNSGKTWRNYC